MNFVWSALMILAIVCSFVTGRVEETMAAGISGAKDSVTVLLSFAGVMCFWSGILRICEVSGASKKCERLLSPVISRLFPKTKAKSQITVNVVANLLGMGNAATPSGVSAMEMMDKENGEKPRPSQEMSRFAVMNTASLQLIPTTIIGILASAGDKNPYAIIPFIWISSSVSLILALLMDAFLYRIERRNEK